MRETWELCCRNTELLKDKSFYVHGSKFWIEWAFSAILHSNISVQQTHALGIHITVF